MENSKRPLRSLTSDNHAVTALEYGMIAALIAVAAATAMTALSGNLQSTLSLIGNTL
jgi:pilus assembly protein Flp/PilA